MFDRNIMTLALFTILVASVLISGLSTYDRPIIFLNRASEMGEIIERKTELTNIDDTATDQDSTELSVNLGGDVTMEFIRISAGKFLMGSPAGESDAKSDEKPQHEVVIEKSYYIGKYVVTQLEYETLTRTNPSCMKLGGRGEARLPKVPGWKDTRRCPVEMVSWADAVKYCEKLSELDKRKNWKFRLPTEAEWEYACRAGTTTPFSFGAALNGLEANCNGQYPYGTNRKGPYLNWTGRVGRYKPNKFGLYDMHGSVFQWCQDWYDADYYSQMNKRDPLGPSRGLARVFRGGGCDSGAKFCRSAARDGREPNYRSCDLGFRVVLLTE